MINAVIIEEKDNVVVAIEALKAGDTVTFTLPEGGTESIKAVDDIPIYHKLSRADLEVDEFVIKYGEHIGVATEKIKKGQHVHVHNIVGRREDLSLKEGV